eukprot:SAG25_NODE_7396_length_483_cov_0.802083_1_plen_78_part_00
MYCQQEAAGKRRTPSENLLQQWLCAADMDMDACRASIESSCAAAAAGSEGRGKKKDLSDSAREPADENETKKRHAMG